MAIARMQRPFHDGLLDNSYLPGGETSTETETHVSYEKRVFRLGGGVTVGWSGRLTPGMLSEGSHLRLVFCAVSVHRDQHWPAGFPRPASGWRGCRLPFLKRDRIRHF